MEVSDAATRSCHLSIACLRRSSSFCSQISVQESSKPDCRALPKKRFTLCGRLISASRRHPAGALHLQDDTGTIACQVSREVARLLSHLIICTDWNYINAKNGGSPFLEISGATLRQPADSPTPACRISVVSVSSALSLHHYRRSLSVQAVNVEATVVAVSEIIRIQSDDVLMVRLCDEGTAASLTLIIKDQNFLHWFHVLEVGETFVFANLQPTTLYKGEASEQKIHTVMRNSRLFLAENVKRERVTLREWLRQFGSPEFRLMDVAEETLPAAPSLCQTTSYEGTIVNCLQAQHGIYIINDDTTLYLPSLIGEEKLCSLRARARVLISNVHTSAPTQFTNKRLHACVFSSLRVLEFSRRTLTQKVGGGCLLSRFVTDHGLPLSCVEPLLRAQDVLRAKLCPEDSRSGGGDCERILCDILCDVLRTPSSVSQHASLQQCDPLLDFINHAAKECAHSQPTNDKQVELLSAVQFVTIENLLAQIADAAKRVDLPNSAGSRTEDGEDPRWSYWTCRDEQLSPKVVLVGVLTTDPLTGNLQLADRTAAVHCVTAPTAIGRHHCSDACHRRPADGCRYACPYMQLSSVDDVVRVDAFRVVVERFASGVTRPYLVFSLRDAVRLAGAESLGERGAAPTAANQKRRHMTEDDDGGGGARRQRTSETDVIIAHLSASGPSSAQDGAGRLGRSAAGGATLNMRTSLLPLPPSAFPLVYQSFVVTNKTSLRCYKRARGEVDLSFTAVTLFPVRTRLATCHDDLLTAPAAETSPPPPPPRHVTLFFRGGQGARLFHLLHPGGAYGLVRTQCNDTTVVLDRLPQGQLERVVQATATCQFFRVDDDFHLFTADADGWSDTQPSPRLTEPSSAISYTNIRDIGSNRSHIELLSMRVFIMGRVSVEANTGGRAGASGRSDAEQQERLKLGVATAADGQVRFVLRDLETADEMLLYVTLSDLSYPLGLLPGACVAFTNVNVHPPSSRGNMYGYYTCASSARVIDVGTICCSSGSDAAPSSSSAAVSADLRLYDMWRPLPVGHPVAATGTFRCRCTVRRVLRVNLATVCDQCSQARPLCRCGATRRAGTTFKATASFMIEDGSGSALVYCDGDRVRQLLDLNAAQWAVLELQSAVESHSYHCEAVDDAVSDIERLLVVLCVSLSVLRSVVLHGRHNGTQQRRVAKMDLQDFELKSMQVQRRELKTRLLPLVAIKLVAMEVLDHNYYSDALIVN